MPAKQKGGDSAGKNMTPKTYRKWNPSGDRTLPPPTIGQSSTTIYLEELCKAGLVTSSSNKFTAHRKWQQTYIIYCNRTSVTKICLPDLSSDSSCRIEQQFRRPKSAHAILATWTQKKILITYSLLHYSSSNILKSPRAPIAKKQFKCRLPPLHHRQQERLWTRWWCSWSSSSSWLPAAGHGTQPNGELPTGYDNIRLSSNLSIQVPLELLWLPYNLVP